MEVPDERACDFWCENLLPKPSLLLTVVEQCYLGIESRQEDASHSFCHNAHVAPVPTIRRDLFISRHRPLLRTGALSTCSHWFCNTGEHRWPRPAYHQSGWPGTCHPRLLAGQTTPVRDF